MTVVRALLQRRSVIQNSNRCRHLRYHILDNYQPRNQFAQHPWHDPNNGPQCDAHGEYLLHFSLSKYRQFRRWLVACCTRRHWKWNTNVCSIGGSSWTEKLRSNTREVLYHQTPFWRCTPRFLLKKKTILVRVEESKNVVHILVKGICSLAISSSHKNLDSDNEICNAATEI